MMGEVVLAVTYGLGGYDPFSPDGNVAGRVVGVPSESGWNVEVRGADDAVVSSRPATADEVAQLERPEGDVQSPEQRIAELEAQLARLIDALGGW